MKYGKYAEVNASSDNLEYEFVSSGPKGDIRKIVQLSPTATPDIYNLAFGNLQMDGSIDDMAVDDNKDRNKILATVVYAVSLFYKEFPDKWIVFTGSTPERTRLYRMAICLNLEELSTEFEIFGILKDVQSFVNVPFEKGVTYFGFLIRKIA